MKYARSRTGLICTMALAVAAMGLTAVPAHAVQGAINTTKVGCVVVNGNIYDTKQDVYLNGNPSALTPGDYWVQVESPSGTLLGKSTSAIWHWTGDNTADCARLWDLVFAASDGSQGYDSTDNNGGEYKVIVSPIDDFRSPGDKSDNFKVRQNRSCKLTCPGNIDAMVDCPAECATITDFGVTSDCSDSTITFDPPAGTCFPIGPPTTVTATLKDPGGVVEDTCHFTVTVTQRANCPPQLDCGGLNITDCNAAGLCSKDETLFPPIVSGSGTVTLTYTKLSGPGPDITTISSSGSLFTFPVGTSTYKIVASNGFPPDAECQFSVTVNDCEAPVCSNPENITVPHDPGVCSAVVNYGPFTATDNCGTVTGTPSPASGYAFPIGTTQVTVTYTDAAGNSTQCKFNVTVLGSISGKKFYDTNANGSDDGGTDPGILGFKILVSDGTTTQTLYTDASGKYSLNVLPGTYTITEVLPSTGGWVQTFQSSPNTVTIDGTTCDGTVNFGNVCTSGPATAFTLGFWGNSNGQKILTGVSGGSALLPAVTTLLCTLNLRQANGSALTSAQKTSYSSFRTWLLGATATNMANMLSAQLATTALDVNFGVPKLDGTLEVRVPKCLQTKQPANVVNTLLSPPSGAGAPGGLMTLTVFSSSCTGTLPCAANDGLTTINLLICAAKNVLGTTAGSNTTASGPLRTYEESLKVLLDQINNMGNPPGTSAYNCPLTMFLSPTGGSCLPVTYP